MKMPNELINSGVPAAFARLLLAGCLLHLHR